uniref:Epidermal growth factor receptor-like transmembrane-juxtamembrane segment domain-containing protein n=1 Tax=Bionectria ochroleuca TaxID=29856 RepID=A0A8H7TS44_BIOOC
MTETMRLPGLMNLALCLIGFHPGYPAFANALDSPMITAAPLIARDGPGQIVGSEVIGYASVDGSYSASSCPPGSILKWEGKYGGCVATSATEYAIWSSCEAESILVASKTKYQCGASVCYTALIFEDLDDKSPRSVYGCSAEPQQASLYIATTGRDATSTSLISNTSTQASVRKTTTGEVASTRTQNPASTASTSSTETDVSDLNSGLGNSQSEDRDLRWIAGPIVGGIVGIVIIGLLIWFMLRRRRKRQAPDVPAAPPDPINTNQSDQATGLQFPTYQWQVQSRESSPRKGQSYHGYMAWTTSSPTDCSSPIPEEKRKEG